MSNRFQWELFVSGQIPVVTDDQQQLHHRN